MSEFDSLSESRESIRENVPPLIHQSKHKKQSQKPDLDSSSKSMYDESVTVDNESVNSPKTPMDDTESVNSDVNSTSSDEPMNHKEVDKKYKRRVLQNSRYT